MLPFFRSAPRRPRSHQPAFTRSKSNAFTLIEIFIVLIIITILSAILFPVFARNRSRNQQAVCLSNERQLSTAWLMYAQDFDQKVVPWSLNGHSASDAFIWDRLIQPYQKNEAILHCPSTNAVVSYSYSANVGGASPSPPLRSLASLKNAAQTPIISDCTGFEDSRNVPGWSFSFIIPDERGGHQARAINYKKFVNGKPTGEHEWAAPSLERTNAAEIKADRHGEGANYIFADGHAKWLHSETDGDGKIIPARKGLDYNSNGALGDNPKDGTAGKYD